MKTSFNNNLTFMCWRPNSFAQDVIAERIKNMYDFQS